MLEYFIKYLLSHFGFASVSDPRDATTRPHSGLKSTHRIGDPHIYSHILEVEGIAEFIAWRDTMGDIGSLVNTVYGDLKQIIEKDPEADAVLIDRDARQFVNLMSGASLTSAGLPPDSIWQRPFVQSLTFKPETIC